MEKGKKVSRWLSSRARSVREWLSWRNVEDDATCHSSSGEATATRGGYTPGPLFIRNNSPIDSESSDDSTITPLSSETGQTEIYLSSDEESPISRPRIVSFILKGVKRRHLRTERYADNGEEKTHSNSDTSAADTTFPLDEKLEKITWQFSETANLPQENHFLQAEDEMAEWQSIEIAPQEAKISQKEYGIAPSQEVMDEPEHTENSLTEHEEIEKESHFSDIADDPDENVALQTQEHVEGRVGQLIKYFSSK